MSGYCKGIYAGCCIAGCMSPCAPCERIRLGKSTVEKEMARKDRAEHRAAMPRKPRAKRVAYCVFCKRSHAGGATCMGHHP